MIERIETLESKNVNKEGEHGEFAIRLIAAAIGSYFTLLFAFGLNTFTWAFMPRSIFQSDYSNIYGSIPDIIGSIVAGCLYGLFIWVLFKKKAKSVIVFSPILLLLSNLVRAYFAYQNSSDTFSPMELLVGWATEPYGFFYFIILPLSSFATIKYFENKSLK